MDKRTNQHVLETVVARLISRNTHNQIGDARRETFYFTHVERGVCLEGPLLATETELRDRLRAILRGRKEKAVLLKADRGLSYGTVIETLDLLNRMGIESLGLVTDTSGTSKR